MSATWSGHRSGATPLTLCGSSRAPDITSLYAAARAPVAAALPRCRCCAILPLMNGHDEEDFATLFEASLKARRLTQGQTIEGTIVAFGEEVAFVNVGGKGEATIALDELRTDDGGLEVAVGDRITAVVVSTQGELVLSRRLARAAATDQHIEDAFRAGLPVEGKVERAVKGG